MLNAKWHKVWVVGVHLLPLPWCMPLMPHCLLPLAASVFVKNAQNASNHCLTFGSESEMWMQQIEWCVVAWLSKQVNVSKAKFEKNKPKFELRKPKFELSKQTNSVSTTFNTVKWCINSAMTATSCSTSEMDCSNATATEALAVLTTSRNRISQSVRFWSRILTPTVSQSKRSDQISTATINNTTYCCRSKWHCVTCKWRARYSLAIMECKKPCSLPASASIPHGFSRHWRPSCRHFTAFAEIKCQQVTEVCGIHVK